MKKICWMVVLMTVMAWLPTPGIAAEFRIGVLNFEKVLQESKSVRDVRGLFLLQVERERGMLRSESEKIAKQEKAFLAARSGLSDAERQNQQREIVNLRTELKNKQDDANRRLKEEDVRILRTIRSEIQQVAHAMLTKEGFALIVDSKSVFAMTAAADITDRVIRIYDTEKKAK